MVSSMEVQPTTRRARHGTQDIVRIVQTVRYYLLRGIQKIMKHLNDILDLVDDHKHFITAKIAVGCDTEKFQGIELDNWIFNSSINYGTFEILKDVNNFGTPYLRVFGYQTFWSSN